MMANQFEKLSNQAEVSRMNASLLNSPAGREDNRGLAESGSLAAERSLGIRLAARPRSESQGGTDVGSGANETLTD
jgi:hypothetical protein